MRMLMGVLVLPALISLLLMLLYSARYDASVSRMETVAALKPLVDAEIAEQVWSVVAGRMDFAECGAYDSIAAVNATLEALIEGGGSSQLELTVARRTMDTLAAYVERIDLNMRTGVPVVQSEQTLSEVRDVAALVSTMLEDSIAWEIETTAATNAQIRRAVFITAVLEMVLLLGALLIANLTRRRTARFIREPIEKLEHFAGLMSSGNLQARVPHTDVTELENLTDRVNVMADRLGALIEQNRQEQENLKKSELRTLQAQINPHFLYNTLDAIIWQAEAGRSAEVIRLTRALSDFFRISLASGADWISVAQEVKHLTGYLAIQKIRYRDILSYALDIPPEMGDSYILKLLLQPLVENALYHGIKDKRGGCLITVTGRMEGGALCFQVTDTGRGMSPEQLREVLASMRGEKPPLYAPYASGGSGFGLNNVDQRIRLYYEQDEGLSIESGPGGTCVRFRVPAKTKEDIANDQGVSGGR